MNTLSKLLYYGYDEPNPPDRGGRLPVALVFPGKQRLAASSLGWQVAYRSLASRPEFSVERFCDDPEFTDSHTGEPFSVDSGTPLAEFPAIALSVNFEEEYLSIISLLERAGIPLRREERNGPLIVSGGPLAFMNPAPMAPVVDAFWVGEAEAGFPDLLKRYFDHLLAGGEQGEFAKTVADLPGVYAPGYTTAPARRVIAPTDDCKGRLLQEPGFSCFLTKKAEFSDMLLLEINRGCPYGCRFCAAGFVYRPPRFSSLETLQQIVTETAPPKVGLLGTALTDWPDLMPFLKWLDTEKIRFSLSSVRADGVTPEFLKFVRNKGLRTLTLALEGPSKRLRTAVNKNLDEADFLNAVRLAAEHQINKLKIYCITGWPGETEEDYAELAEFATRIQEARKEGQGKRKKGIEVITISCSPLVPKPWTPFQWAPMATEKALEQAGKWVRAAVKPHKGFKAEVGPTFGARLQAILSRVGEEGFELVRLAHEKGGWRKALKYWDGEIMSRLEEEWPHDMKFPWDVIDVGVDREYLWREWNRYKKGARTRPCPAEGCEKCLACGCESYIQEQS